MQEETSKRKRQRKAYSPKTPSLKTRKAIKTRQSKNTQEIVQTKETPQEIPVGQ